MITENHGLELFSVPIKYDATQTQSQTLDTLPRDPPKEPKTKKHKKETRPPLSHRQNQTPTTKLIHSREEETE